MPATEFANHGVIRTGPAPKVNVTLPGRPDSVPTSSAVQSIIEQLSVELSRIRDIIDTQGNVNVRLLGQPSNDPPRPEPESTGVDSGAPLFVQAATLLAHLDAAITEMGARARFPANVV